MSEKIFKMLVAGVAQYLARCLRRTKSGVLAGCRPGDDENQALTMMAAELAEGMRLTRRRVMWDGQGGPVVTKWKKDPYSTSALFLSMSFDRMMREAFVAKGVFDRMRELARGMKGSSFSERWKQVEAVEGYVRRERLMCFREAATVTVD